MDARLVADERHLGFLKSGRWREVRTGRRNQIRTSSTRPAGLYAISLGLSAVFADDQELLRYGLVLYDGLFAWCADLQHETHDWPPAEYRAIL